MLSEAEHILHPSPPVSSSSHSQSQSTSHHHRSADELAVAEAESILGVEELSQASPALRSGRLRREAGRGRGELVVEIPMSQSMAKRQKDQAQKKALEDDEVGKAASSSDLSDLEDEGNENETSAILGSDVGIISAAGAADAGLAGEGMEENLVKDSQDTALPADSSTQGNEAEPATVAMGDAPASPEWPTSPESSFDNNNDLISTNDIPLLQDLADDDSTTPSASAQLDMATPQAPTDLIDAADSSSESESEEDSDSSSTSDSDTSDIDEEEDDDDTSEDEAAEDARLEKLLEAAKLSARGSGGQSGGLGGKPQGQDMDDDMLRLDAEEDTTDA